MKKREREATARSVRDELLKKEITRVREDRKIGRRVYGARKVWREGICVARCAVERLMGEPGIAYKLVKRGGSRTVLEAWAPPRSSGARWNGCSGARRRTTPVVSAANHVEHIYSKLGVSSRAAATLYATQHGLLGAFEPAS